MRLLLIFLLTLTTQAQDLFVFAGQSNMQGYGLTKELKLQDLDNQGVYGWDWLYKIWRHNPDPTKHEYVFHPERLYGHKIHDLGDNFGPELFTLKSIHKSTGNKVYFIKYAVGGSSLQDWENTHYNILDLEIGWTNRNVASWFWMQGEADADYLESALSYKERLKEFINKVNAPRFIAGMISERWPYASIVRDDLYDLNKDKVLSIVGTDDFSVYKGDDNHPDGLSTAHYDTESIKKLGYKFAVSYLHCSDVIDFPALVGDFNGDSEKDYLVVRPIQSIKYFEVVTMKDFKILDSKKLIVSWTGKEHFALPNYFKFNGVSDPDNDGDDDITHTDNYGLWIWKIDYPYITKSAWKEE